MFWPVLFLYIGPPAILPLFSALAASAGVVLLFWRQMVALTRKAWRRTSRREP